MKIETKILKEYLSKVSLNTSIMTLGLNFTSDGVVTKVTNTMNTAMVLGKLKKEAFEEYEEIGEIYIKDSRMLINILKTFDGVIDFEKLGDNVIKISSGKRKAHIILAEEKICDNIVRKDRPNIETAVSVELFKHTLTQTVKDMGLLDVTKATFKKTGDKLYISIGDKKEYDFIENLVDCEGEEDVVVSVADAFKDVVEAIGESVIVHLGTDLPLIFEDNKEHMEIETFLSPIVSLEE